jgi:LCP family protein required for cell wall assembly
MRIISVSKFPYLKMAIIAIASVVLIVCAFLGLNHWEKNRRAFSEQEFGNESITYNGEEYILKCNLETFLVIGLDKTDRDESLESYNNDMQADFVMLFVFDNDTKQCTALQINRDTMTDVNILGVAGNKIDTQTKQIALSHTYGNGKDVSCRNTADSVSALLHGMKINHYASVTMDAVPVFNDLVGGVEVVVLDDFTGIDASLVKDTTVKLSGKQALTYVQSRQGLEDSSNSTRMKRQQQYVKALYETFNKCAEADNEFIADAALKMSEYMVSDRSVNQLQVLADKFKEYEFLGIKNIDGKLEQGERFMEFYPDEKSLEKIIVELFYMPKV